MRSRHLLMTTDAVGGVWTYALDLAEALVDHDVRTTLLVMGPAPGEDQRRRAASVRDLTLRETDLPLDWCAETAAQIGDASARIMALARELGADLLQLHTPALAIAGEGQVPVISVIHSCLASWWLAMESGPIPRGFAWRTELVAEGLSRSDRIIVPSRAFGESIARCYRLAEPLTVIHNGRRPSAITPRATDGGALTAGRLWDRGKNVATMDAAAARLSMPFRAAGDLRGPNGDEVQLTHLHALGRLDDDALATLMASRPVFVSAARYEPFGLAVLEAAAAGCALVLSDIPTFRELWDGAAIFVPALDADGFARAIGRLIDDAEMRSTLGQCAADRARTYSVAAMAAHMARIYEPLAPRQGRHAA